MNWKLMRKLLWWAILVALGVWWGHKAHADEGQLEFCIERQDMLDATADDAIWAMRFRQHKCFSLQVNYVVEWVERIHNGYLGEVNLFMPNVEWPLKVYSVFSSNPIANRGREATLVDWKPEYQQAAQSVQQWYQEQQVTARSRPLFHCVPDLMSVCSCCNGAEVVKTKFRVTPNRDDGWQWLDPKDNEWKDVPEEVIHWGEPTPDGQAVLFEYPIGSSKVRCFFPPNGDGG